MNLKSKFQSFLSDVKQLEGKYKDLIQNGSTDPMNYHYMSYYSGVIGGFNMAWYPLDNNITEKEFDEMVKKVLQQSEMEVN